MTDQPTTRHDGTAHGLAHKIIMRTLDYMSDRITTNQLYRDAVDLIEQDRHAVRCEVARQASSLISPSRSTPDTPQG